VYWFIFLRPASPSFFSCSSCGETVVISCMMIDAEMYGMMFSAKMVMRPSAPPAKTSNRPRMPRWFCWKISARICGSMPGIGM
jgi:hypothetical protein